MVRATEAVLVVRECAVAQIDLPYKAQVLRRICSGTPPQAHRHGCEGCEEGRGQRGVARVR
jgi:hypothetical protein